MMMSKNNAAALRGREASVLTDDERTALCDASWASFAKANALLHGAADVIEELHCHAGFDGNDMALQALVVVFCERCTRRSLNPRKEFASWLADEMWWRNEGSGCMAGFPRESDGEVAIGGARQAISELRRAGLITRTAKRTKSPSGKAAYACRITVKGQEYLEAVKAGPATAGREVCARAAWLQTKDRALRALVAAAVGTREEQSAYERDLQQSGEPGASGS